MRTADARAALKRTQAAILALTERAPRAATGWVPPKQVGLIKPCPRCGRGQPANQTDAAIRAYSLREPTSVLYTRADGTVRAHAIGCDALPHGEIKPDRAPDAPVYVSGANAGLAGKSGTPEPLEVWANRDRAAAPLY